MRYVAVEYGRELIEQVSRRIVEDVTQVLVPGEPGHDACYDLLVVRLYEDVVLADRHELLSKSHASSHVLDVRVTTRSSTCSSTMQQVRGKDSTLVHTLLDTL